MAGVPGIPQNFNVQTANQQILASWNLSPGATSYQVQRSLDNVTFVTVSTISGSPLATSYLDTAVTIGTQYWYTVTASNDGINYSSPTQAQSAVPTLSGEQCLSLIRLSAMQRADRVNSNFVTITEWNQYINQSMFELYDLLTTVYEDYFLAPPVQFVADGVTYQYPVPNGVLTFLNANNPAVSFVPQPLYKLMGVDLALQNTTSMNSYVTINKFNFIDRNRFVYPNTASTIYGVFNLQYRLMGNQLYFIPTPSAGQAIRLWYIPRLTELLQDTDVTIQGISGWIEYVIVRAAKYALDKEESSTAHLDAELLFLKGRIEESAANRDAGQTDTISNTRVNTGGQGPNGSGSGFNGGIGGWAMILAPLSNSTNIFHSWTSVFYCSIAMGLMYVLNLRQKAKQRV